MMWLNLKLRWKILSSFLGVILFITVLLGYILFKIDEISISMSELQAKAPQFDEIINNVNNLQTKVYPVFEETSQ